MQIRYFMVQNSGMVAKLAELGKLSVTNLSSKNTLASTHKHTKQHYMQKFHKNNINKMPAKTEQIEVKGITKWKIRWILRSASAAQHPLTTDFAYTVYDIQCLTNTHETPVNMVCLKITWKVFGLRVDGNAEFRLRAKQNRTRLIRTAQSRTTVVQ